MVMRYHAGGVIGLLGEARRPVGYTRRKEAIMEAIVTPRSWGRIACGGMGMEVSTVTFAILLLRALDEQARVDGGRIALHGAECLLLVMERDEGVADGMAGQARLKHAGSP